jgi:ParB family chromosome partitioning protein
MKVPITEISIRERVRKDIGDLSPLMESMQKHGQLNPITITRDNELIAGHRRLLSARELGWSYIDALIVDRNSELEKLQLELEENVHRKDFSPEELLEGYRRLDKLLRPGITRRIGSFFMCIFERLFFWRKRRNKQVAHTIKEAASEVYSEEEDSKVSRTANRTKSPEENSSEIGQYGV